MMNIRITSVSDYISNETKRYAEMLSENFWSLNIKVIERYDEVKIKFVLHKFNADLALIIDKDGQAYFFKKEKKSFFKKAQHTKMVIAEWNDFADPFEAALAIQLKMYKVIKSLIMKENSYCCHMEEFTSADEICFDEFSDEETENEEDLELDDELENKMSLENLISTQSPKVSSSSSFSETGPLISSPFMEVNEESYLDFFEEVI